MFLHLQRAKDASTEADLSNSTGGTQASLQQDLQADLSQASGLVCRSCRGGHWTTKCPFKDKIVPLDANGSSSQSDASASGSSSKYIPPNQRARMMNAGGERDDSLTVRVTNLSQFTTEPDLQMLLHDLPSGSITRIFVVREWDTGLCKGYAFVSFVDRATAERAISILNGHGFGNLIIKAEFAAPKPVNSGGGRFF